MGLDITAYSRLIKLDVVFDADGEPIDPLTREPLDWHGYMRVYVNDDFPGRAEGLENKACYAYGDSFGFRAGSYGGYNQWREALATLADYPPCPYQRDEHAKLEMRRDAAAWQGKAEGLPFVELVNFSDCEGVIGPTVSAKLARDFAEWDDRAKAADTALGAFFYERFTFWRKAFEMAANNGAVSFH